MHCPYCEHALTGSPYQTCPNCGVDLRDEWLIPMPDSVTHAQRRAGRPNPMGTVAGKREAWRDRVHPRARYLTVAYRRILFSLLRSRGYFSRRGEVCHP